MWLMTKLGFYSIVEKTRGEFHIRSRARVDLENLVRVMPAAALIPEVVSTPHNDYPFRLVVPGWWASAALGSLGHGINYVNFKDEVARRSDQREKPYHEVWAVMRRQAEQALRPRMMPDAGEIDWPPDLAPAPSVTASEPGPHDVPAGAPPEPTEEIGGLF